jgi:hypothetical protein
MRSAAAPGAPGRPSAFYLNRSGEPVFAVMHAPAPERVARVPVLICPPFGWEEVCSHRSCLTWADLLSVAGHPTLRIDLPSTGDSAGSPEDKARLEAWISAVADSASWLAADSGQPAVAAIGIGLGGLLVCLAAAANAPIEQVVLWATPARGSACVRELRAFARLEESKFGPLSDGDAARGVDRLAAGGFALSAETVAALEKLDLTGVVFPRGRLRRAVLLGRDGIPAEKGLCETLERAGAAVEMDPGTGFVAMMDEPQQARPAFASFDVVRTWLARDNAASQPPRWSGCTVARERAAKLTTAGATIIETPLEIEQSFGRLCGVLSCPEHLRRHGLGAVLLNAGAIRRIGPNRMWVDIARRWAAMGLPTLRLDLEGLGDADGDASRFADVAELYVPAFVSQVRAAMDHLQELGVARRFVLTGLCSGAYWSFHGAVQDERVAAAFMLNPRTLFWDESVENVRYLRRGLLDPASWRMIVNGDVSLARVARVAAAAPHSLVANAIARWRARGESDALELALDHLRSTGKQIAFVFSEHEPLYQELERHGRVSNRERWPNVEFELLPGRDHTLRPAESQRRAHEALDRALERELERIAS